MSVDISMKKFLTLGEVLPNGAQVIDYQADRKDIDGDMMPGGVVLALWPSSPDPYVTWTYGYSSVRDEICCFNGHYHDKIAPAVLDFMKRVEGR